MSVLLILDIRTLASVYLPQMVSILPKPKVHAGSLVSFPDPFRKNREGVWQHVLHCSVQKEFNQLLNHVLMFTRASGNWMCDQPAVCSTCVWAIGSWSNVGSVPSVWW